MTLKSFETVKVTVEARLPCGCTIAMANALTGEDQPNPVVHLADALDIWLQIKSKQHVCAKEPSHAG